MKKKFIFTSLASIAMCATLFVGGTYALFTSEAKTNITISTGVVKVTSTISDFSMSSRDVDRTNEKTFVNGGTASVENGNVTLSLLTPGDKVSFNINVTNESNVAAAYRTKVGFLKGAEKLLGTNGLIVKVNDEVLGEDTIYTQWATAPKGALETIKVEIELPYNAGNEYQGIEDAVINFTVFAVQGNGELAKYGEAYITHSDGTWTDGYTLEKAFDSAVAGDEITLLSDVEVDTQIDISRELGTNFTFDGDGYTITVNTNNDPFNVSDGSLFYLDTPMSTTFKNVNIEGAARFGFMYRGGHNGNNILEKVSITGNYYYTINCYGDSVVTLKDCDINNSLNGGTKNSNGSAIWRGNGTEGKTVIDGGYVSAIAASTSSATQPANIILDNGAIVDVAIVPTEDLVQVNNGTVNSYYYLKQITNASDLVNNAFEPNSIVFLTENEYDFSGANINLPEGITLVGNGETELKDVKFNVSDENVANFQSLDFVGETTIQAYGDGALSFVDCVFNIAPEKYSGFSRAAAIIGANQYYTLDLNVENCVFNYQQAGADTYNAAIFMWSAVRNVNIKNNVFNGYGFVAIKLMNAVEGANIVFEGNTFNMSKEGSANYWYNNAIQIMPQHDRTMNIVFEGNNFNGDFETDANNNSVVAYISVMHETSPLTKCEFKHNENKVNGVAATDVNFVIVD